MVDKDEDGTTILLHASWIIPGTQNECLRGRAVMKQRGARTSVDFAI
jgi:hypothetical protein